MKFSLFYLLRKKEKKNLTFHLQINRVFFFKLSYYQCNSTHSVTSTYQLTIMFLTEFIVNALSEKFIQGEKDNIGHTLCGEKLYIYIKKKKKIKE